MATTNGVTPERGSWLSFDDPEYIAVEPPFSFSRFGAEICRDTDAQKNTVNVEMLSTGVWVLKTKTAVELQQTYQGQLTIQTKAKLNTANHMQEHNRYRRLDDLFGVVYSSSVAPYADPFIRKAVASPGTWNQSLVSDSNAFPPPPIDYTFTNVDRIAVTKAQIAADTPMTYRFEVPGTKINAHGVIAIWYFGGPAMPTGHGQFCMVFYGDGLFSLNEYCKDIVAGTREAANNWHTRNVYRFTEDQQIGGVGYTVRVYPHKVANGGFALDITTSVASRPANPGSLFSTRPKTSPIKQTYILPKNRWLQSEVRSRRINAVGVGYSRLDEPRDTRTSHQISLVQYRHTGVLQDDPFAMTFFATPRTNMRLIYQADIPAGTTLIGRIYDAKTGAECTEVTRGASYAEYKINHKSFHYFVVFYFTADALDSLTPALRGYTIHKDGTIIQTSQTPFIAKAVQYSITGQDMDPSHETAHAKIKDVSNKFAALQTRDMIPVRVKTNYLQSDLTKYSVLFQGYTNKVKAHKKGVAGQVFPDPGYCDYTVDMLGMWERMKESISFAKFPLAPDPDAPVDPITGAVNAYKVTDVVRNMVTWMGFPPSQIDVPDNPMRFSMGQIGNDMILDSMINIGDWCMKSLKDYIGWYLIYDANAGTDGMVRAIAPKTGTLVNMASFVTSTPVGHLPNSAGSYGGTGWVGTSVAPAQGFILRDTFDKWVTKPEANFVAVFGSNGADVDGSGSAIVGAWACNFKSVSAFCKPDGTIINSADPTNRDYTHGALKPMMVFDSMLFGQSTVNYVCRRIFDIACHAVDRVSFEAPLILVTDLADGFQTRPRPLRYYDPVLVNGVQYIITSVNPSWHKDARQTAFYECQKPNAIYGA